MPEPEAPNKFEKNGKQALLGFCSDTVYCSINSYYKLLTIVTYSYYKQYN